MPPPPTANDGPLYAALAAGGMILFACLASQLGGRGLLVAMMVAGGIALFTLLNYWMWGWRLQKDEDSETSRET